MYGVKGPSGQIWVTVKDSLGLAALLTLGDQDGFHLVQLDEQKGAWEVLDELEIRRLRKSVERRRRGTPGW